MEIHGVKLTSLNLETEHCLEFILRGVHRGPNMSTDETRSGGLERTAKDWTIGNTKVKLDLQNPV